MAKVSLIVSNIEVENRYLATPEVEIMLRLQDVIQKLSGDGKTIGEILDLAIHVDKK